MIKTRNPFIDDSIVLKDDYCPREQIEKRILEKIENGHNLALIGDRRIGKTSTAHFVVDNIKDFYKLDVDLYHVTNSSDIAETIIDACIKILDQVWDSKKVLDFARRITPKLDISDEGISFGVGTKEPDYKKTLNVAFEFLEETIKRTNSKLVILFDEFQAINDLKDGEVVLKYMRGKIQKISRIPFVYVGSIRNEMDHIFRDQSSPFFKQAEIIYFEHIEANIFYDFLLKKFKLKKITLEKDAYNYLYQICYGITGDLQTFCRVAFDTLPEGAMLNFEMLFSTLEIIYKNEQKYFKSVLDGKELTSIQKKLLIQLAGAQENANTKLFTQDFQKVIGVKSPGAIINALGSLEKKEFIYKTDEYYCFANPFFKEWILDYRFTMHARAGNATSGQLISGTRLDFGYRQRLISKK
jgi:AAA+ ATPase superfamily predicted ATPase